MNLAGSLQGDDYPFVLQTPSDRIYGKHFIPSICIFGFMIANARFDGVSQVMGLAWAMKDPVASHQAWGVGCWENNPFSLCQPNWRITRS